MYKRCDACALLLHGNKRSLYLLTQRNYGIIRETQFLLWQKTNTRKLFMMPGPYSNDLRWNTICPGVALWDPLRWRNAKHFKVCHPISLNTMVVYHLSFRKIRLESKWDTFWVVPAEDFRKQQNIWKASPVFPDGMFQTEILVDTSFRYIFRARFSVNGTDLSRFVQMVKTIPGRKGRLEGFKVSSWILKITKLVEYRTE